MALSHSQADVPETSGGVSAARITGHPTRSGCRDRLRRIGRRHRLVNLRTQRSLQHESSSYTSGRTIADPRPRGHRPVLIVAEDKAIPNFHPDRQRLPLLGLDEWVLA